MPETLNLLGLFLSAFLAATLIPAQSELGLGYLILYTDYSVVMLIMIASFGNTCGAIINWIIGRGIANSVMRLEKIQQSSNYSKITFWYQRFGQWTLLLSWVPIVGDPITIIAGTLKMPFKNFLFIVALAKTTRYLVVAYLTKEFVFSASL